jgi:hypothetical protein
VTVAQDKETFVGRWSRLKHESKQLPEKEEEKKDTAPPPLPPVDKLTPESDFTGFMHPKVEDALRRVALKKLFSDPHFNTPDPYEAYSGDWTVGEPISDEMMATLNQARTLLFEDKDKKKDENEQQTAAVAPAVEDAAKKDDEPGRQDT